MKEAKPESAPSLKPPKEWFNKLSKQIKKANPEYSDEKIKATIGSIWYHLLDTKKKKEIRGREGKTFGKAQEDTIVPNALKDYLDAVEKAASDNDIDTASLIDAVVIIDLIPPKEEAIGDGPNFGEQPAVGVKRSLMNGTMIHEEVVPTKKDFLKFKTTLDQWLKKNPVWHGAEGAGVIGMNLPERELTISMGNIDVPIEDAQKERESFLTKLSDFLYELKTKGTYPSLLPNWEEINGGDELKVIVHGKGGHDDFFKENWYGVSAIVNESKDLNEVIEATTKVVDEVLAVLGKGLKPEKLAELKEEIEESLDFDGDVGTFKADGITYKLISDEETAEQMAEEELKDFIDSEGPEMFSDNFVRDYFYVTDTDKRLIANDDADYYVEDLSVERLLEEAEMEDEYEIANEAGDAEKMALIEKEAKEKVHDNKYKDTYEYLKTDPLNYFKDIGYEIKDAVEKGLLSFNTAEAVREAVRLDGWAHTLSRYDGNYEETKSGMVFFRED